MPWITRGLREGIVTSHYPRRPDGYGEDFHAGVTVRPESAAQGGRTGEIDAVVTACPTGAICLDRDKVSIDRGRCIVCERCVLSRPDVFISQSDIETATLRRTHLVSPVRPDSDEEIADTRKELAKRVRALRRSVHIRHLDCGSDGAEEWEIAALTNPIYDIQRLGVFFTASPRHADLLLVTGAGAAGMLGPLALTYEAMANPKVVVAVGTDAVSGGLFANTYATRGGIGGSVEVDVFVPGSPPSPFSIMHGILLAVDLLPARRMP
ncbi:MAG: NADH-quinone oxidoreductase subunit B family protein [Acidimicrobiales bacterium]